MTGDRPFIELVQGRMKADAENLRALAFAEKDRRVARRILAIASLAEGTTEQQAAACLGVTRTAIRDWWERYQAGGIDALRDRKGSGRPGLDSDQRAELAAMIRTQPRIARHELWRYVRTRFGFDYTPTGLARLVRDELGFVRRDGAYVLSTAAVALTQ